MLKVLRMSALAMILLASAAMASDSAGMREEISDLRAKVAALESAEMAPAAGGDAASLTSMKKKGTITIGGGVETTVVINRADDRAWGTDEDDEVDSTNFMTTDACLIFNIAANKNSGLVLKLDLDDFWDEPDAGEADQDDLLEEAYFYFKNIGGSAFDVNFGKKEVPFGQDKDVLLLDGVMHSSAHFLGFNRGLVNFGANATKAQPHNDNTGNDWWPVEVDNRFQINPSWKYKDLLKVEFALFQDSRTMHEDRSNDTLFFESYATRATLTPIEGLSLEVSFMNQHNDGANTAEAENEEQDVKSLSLGFDYKFGGKYDVEVFGEYAHGWDGDNNDEYDVDVFQLGVVYGITEALDLIITGNYVNLDLDEAIGGAASTGEESDLWSVQIGVQYTLDSGIILEAAYQHDWYEIDTDLVDEYDQSADALAFGIKWKF